MKKIFFITLIIITVMISACTSYGSEPESEMWGTWTKAENQGADDAFAKTLTFYDDGNLIFDGQDADAAQYVVIAPGKIKITQGGEEEVINYEVSEEQLKLYFKGGENQYVRMEEAPSAQSTEEEISEVQPASTPTQKSFVEDFVDSVFSKGEVITPQNAVALAELRRVEQNGLINVIWSPSGNEIVVSTRTGIHLFSPENLKERRSFADGSGSSGVVFSPNEQLIAYGVSNGELQLWDVETEVLLGIFDGNEYGVISLAFSPDGTKLAATCVDDKLKIWNIKNNRLLISRDIILHDRFLVRSNALQFSPDGSILATGSGDNAIYLWDPTNGTLIRKLEGHQALVRDIVFSPDGRLLTSAGLDSTVRLWDVENGVTLNILKGHSDRVNSVTFSPNGEILVSGGSDGMIFFWDVNTGENLSALEAHFGDELIGIANLETPCDDSPSPPAEPMEDKPYLIVDPTCGVSTSEEVKKDPESGDWERIVTPGTEIHVEGYNFDPKREIEIWWKDPSSNQFRHREEGDTVRVVPDEEGCFEIDITWPYRIIPDSYLEGEEIWQLQGRQNISVGEKSFSVNNVSFSPDGRYLVSCGGDGTLKIWGVP